MLQTTPYSPPRFLPNSLPLPSGHRHRIVPAGTVASARFLPKSPLKTIRAPGSCTASQKAGRRYEARVLKELKKLSQELLIAQPWIGFELTSGAEHTCQVDAILLRKDYAVIFEIKLTHTIDAYWQLRYLYSPVVRQINPATNMPQHLVEITRSFDPSYLYPEEMKLFFDLPTMLTHLDNSPPDSQIINVLQWKL